MLFMRPEAADRAEDCLCSTYAAGSNARGYLSHRVLTAALDRAECNPVI